MARKNIELGVIPTGQGGDTFRSAMIKVNDMTEELYEKTAGSQPGATKNRPDAELLNRANHTGSQLASTISDFSSTVKNVVEEFGVGGVSLPAMVNNSFNDNLINGKYRWDATSVAAPSTANVDGFVEVFSSKNATRITQVAYNTQDNRVWWRSFRGATWGPWKPFILEGDFGVGAKDNAVFAGTSLSPDGYVTGGYVTGQFSINGTNFTGCLITQAGSNGSACSQQFMDWNSGRYYTRTKTGNIWKPWTTPLIASDYGIGSKGEGVNYLADANVPPASGKARVQPETANGPGVYGTLEQSYLDTGSWTQTVTNIVDGTVFARSKASWLPNPTEWTRQTPETITNANGTATKFPDGTMICRYRGARVTANNANGQLFVSGSNIVTFAATFIDVPVVTVICSDPQVGHCWGIVTTPVNGSNCGIGLMSGLNGSSCAISYMAIGRWR